MPMTLTFDIGMPSELATPERIEKIDCVLVQIVTRPFGSTFARQACGSM